MVFLIVILIIALAVVLTLGIRRLIAAPTPIKYYSSPVVYEDDIVVDDTGYLAAAIVTDLAVAAIEEAIYEETFYGDDD